MGSWLSDVMVGTLAVRLYPRVHVVTLLCMSEVQGSAVRDEPMQWPVHESTDHYRGDWVMAFREDTVSSPGGDERFARLVLEHPGAAVVLAVDDDERVLCLRQYRHAARRRFVELPAGLLDEPGEPPLETARRELLEEAELTATSWRELLATFPSAGITSEVQHIFLARGLATASRGDFAPHAEEADMETVWVPMADLLDAVLDGRVQEGPLAQAVMAYTVLGHRGEL